MLSKASVFDNDRSESLVPVGAGRQRKCLIRGQEYHVRLTGRRNVLGLICGKSESLGDPEIHGWV